MRRLSLLAVLACAFATAPAMPAQANPARDVVTHVNQFRVAHGLKKLRISTSLSHTALAYSRHLLRVDRFGHARRIQASGRFRRLGENLTFQWGWRRSARYTVRAWKNSPGHRALMLDPTMRYIGVGRAAGRFGKRRATVWTLQAGR